MRTKLDKQPRKPSKQDVDTEKLHPASDMGKRAKGGDKMNSNLLRKKEKSTGAATTMAKKPNRP
ncbi:MAG TPA: hypothetical protein VHL79_00880 [Ramlibacter sp.]|jgi:hypothetical protein|nr:hypothetical protein [Ramlibacter sp.]